MLAEVNAYFEYGKKKPAKMFVITFEILPNKKLHQPPKLPEESNDEKRQRANPNPLADSGEFDSTTLGQF